MNPLNTLSQLIHQSDYEMIYVLGVPRSGGSALQIALTQADEVTHQLDEPFHVMQEPTPQYKLTPAQSESHFHKGCARIVAAYERSRASLPKQTASKIIMVLHDITQTLTVPHAATIMKLSRHIVFTIREPLANALSLFTRYTNDRWSLPFKDTLSSQETLMLLADGTNLEQHVKTLGEKICPDTIRNHLQKAKDAPITAQDLQELRTLTLNLIEEEYSNAWKQLQAFVAEAEKLHLPHTIFDHSRLGQELSVKALTQRIAIAYTPKIMNGWTKATGDAYDCEITRGIPRDIARHNAWNGQAQNSTGLLNKPSDAPPSVEQFPAGLRPIIQHVQKLYQELLAKAIV